MLICCRSFEAKLSPCRVESLPERSLSRRRQGAHAVKLVTLVLVSIDGATLVRVATLAPGGIDGANDVFRVGVLCTSYAGVANRLANARGQPTAELSCGVFPHCKRGSCERCASSCPFECISRQRVLTGLNA